jgi:hypothetical protein
VFNGSLNDHINMYYDVRKFITTPIKNIRMGDIIKWQIIINSRINNMMHMIYRFVNIM